MYLKLKLSSFFENCYDVKGFKGPFKQANRHLHSDENSMQESKIHGDKLPQQKKPEQNKY